MYLLSALIVLLPFFTNIFSFHRCVLFIQQLLYEKNTSVERINSSIHLYTCRTDGKKNVADMTKRNPQMRFY
jgi:hypothetical protein